MFTTALYGAFTKALHDLATASSLTSSITSPLPPTFFSCFSYTALPFLATHILPQEYKLHESENLHVL